MINIFALNASLKININLTSVLAVLQLTVPILKLKNLGATFTVLFSGAEFSPDSTGSSRKRFKVRIIIKDGERWFQNVETKC